jgi:serine/threonine protein kinase
MRATNPALLCRHHQPHALPPCSRLQGTITHMPPEMLLFGRASKAADVYAFGILCW